MNVSRTLFVAQKMAMVSAYRKGPALQRRSCLCCCLVRSAVCVLRTDFSRRYVICGRTHTGDRDQFIGRGVRVTEVEGCREVCTGVEKLLCHPSDLTAQTPTG